MSRQEDARERRAHLYRVTLVVEYLGWVDYDSGHSSVCLVLLGQMGIWQNRLVNKAMWWNIRNLSQPNQGMRPPESPCILVIKLMDY